MEDVLLFLAALFFLIIFIVWSHSGAAKSRRLKAQKIALDQDPKRIGRIAVLELSSANKAVTIVTLVVTILILLYCFGTEKHPVSRPNQRGEKEIPYHPSQSEKEDENSIIE